MPIPNTAVKPSSADGTWGNPGRVGRRRELVEKPCGETRGAFRIGNTGMVLLFRLNRLRGTNPRSIRERGRRNIA